VYAGFVTGQLQPPSRNPGSRWPPPAALRRLAGEHQREQQRRADPAGKVVPVVAAKPGEPGERGDSGMV